MVHLFGFKNSWYTNDQKFPCRVKILQVNHSSRKRGCSGRAGNKREGSEPTKHVPFMLLPVLAFDSPANKCNGLNYADEQRERNLRQEGELHVKRRHSQEQQRCSQSGYRKSTRCSSFVIKLMQRRRFGGRAQLAEVGRHCSEQRCDYLISIIKSNSA